MNEMTQGTKKDPAEQELLARDLASEFTDLFVQFIRGEVPFHEVSFAAYDILQDLHIIWTGAYELVESENKEFDNHVGSDEQENCEPW